MPLFGLLKRILLIAIIPLLIINVRRFRREEAIR